ncbi:uncharacterized protein si:ch73-52p7.1 [Syngnathoides biaculeatus]|uniref:uncharacterized protein si:ch73-52p7.1 n=1 Tax=Syngnathoides biaculeatus TaxID=300417 RepID=UPI002ADDF3E9|nr:uncharacterized protein si:ch73-52p7.1 [Syngnathoides biaculeatus]XP_061693938.1 uncharacterized protein si:ch73-52p7.1 [Syngnathoides biaculeatus]
MASPGPPAPLLCVLLWVLLAPQRSEMCLAYVTHDSFFYYSCSQEPQACSAASLAACRCRTIPLSTLQPPSATPYPSPMFRMRRLTVWYTSPWNTARLLNNSEVHHLTLMDCGGELGEAGAPFLEGHFTVQQLEQLSVIDFPQMTQTKTESESDNDLHFDADRWRLRPPSQVQNIFLGRELGAAFHEQARLGVIHGSVLRGGAEAVKVYTVQTQIDSDGTLPFPDLRLPKLPVTSVIYVSFVYRREQHED